MSGTLLVLGSKPDPVLPRAAQFDAVACANGSGYSAAKHGLPAPRFTVMSAVLGSLPSGLQSISALSGLSTERLYFSPRPDDRRGVRRMLRTLKTYDMQPFWLKRKLREASYSFGDFVVRPHAEYLRLVRNLCEGAPDVLALVDRKQPSTGMMTLAIGAGLEGFDRFILSGFSFELTHAYGNNPEIAERGTQVSGHADTDVAFLRHLAGTLGTVFTTEPIVTARTGIPELPE